MKSVVRWLTPLPALFGLLSTAVAGQAVPSPRQGPTNPGLYGADVRAASADLSRVAPARPAAIDSFIFHATKIQAADVTANGQFGATVAVFGDTALIGAPHDIVGGGSDSGSVSVFVRTGGVWALQQKLTVPQSAGFGGAVALSGDTALVGETRDFSNPSPFLGSVFVFVRSGGVWSLQQKLTVPDPDPIDDPAFGCSVALSGETAVVGALDDDSGGDTDQGSAYVFVRSAGVWSLQQKLVPGDGGPEINFGTSVALSGDTALIAAPDPIGVPDHNGAAYVFVRTGGVWTQQQKLADDPGMLSSSGFAYAAALSGDTALVGGFLTYGQYAGQKVAYVFVREGGVWREQQKLTNVGGAQSYSFGFSVALDGNVAVVSAPHESVGPNLLQGSAYLFLRSGGVWTLQQRMTAADGAGQDTFGASLALSGGSGLAGTPHSSGQGSVYALDPRLPRQILPNGGMEADANRDGLPDGWQKANWTALDGRTIAVKQKGAASVRLVGNGRKKTMQRTILRSGAAGETVHFSIHAKAAAAPIYSFFSAQLLVYGGATLLSSQVLDFPKGTYGFTRRTLNYLATAPYTRIVVKLVYHSGGGKVWFDTAELGWMAP